METLHDHCWSESQLFSVLGLFVIVIVHVYALLAFIFVVTCSHGIFI